MSCVLRGRSIPSALLWCGVTTCFSARALAQDPGGDPATQEAAPPQSLEELRRALDLLQKEHAEAELKLKALEDEQKKIRDDTEDLKIDQELAEKAREKEKSTSTVSQALNYFNPQITAFGNFLGRMDDRTVRNADGDAIDDRFLLRESEVDFRAAVDPWADAVLILTLEESPTGEFEVGVEEGYVELKKLPILDSAPLGLKLKAGRFRPSVSRINRIHLHDLPWMTEAPSFMNVLGEEGLIQDGFSGEFFLPTPGDSNSLDATLAIFNGGGVPVQDQNHGDSPSYLGRLHWFWEVASAHTIDLGASLLHGYYDSRSAQRSDLVAGDFTYLWKPTRQGEWHSFLLGGEAYYAGVEGPVQDSSGNQFPSSSSVGGFTYAQYQFTRNLFLGERYDYTQDFVQNQKSSQQFGTYLTFYTTEFLRFRLGWQHTESDLSELNHLDTALFELNFVFGSHPVEPYWVNR